MATNPMQRKARNSFLGGVLITLVLATLVIALLLIQLKNYKEKEAQEQANSAKVWVLNQDVISGQIITTDMLTQQEINKTKIPANAIGDTSILTNYSLTDKEGNELKTVQKNGETKLYLVDKDTKREQEINMEETGSYYIGSGDNKKIIEFYESPIIAKVKMDKNTVLTMELVTRSDEKTTNDLRKQEYNMLILPTQLQTGEYIDIRLSLPSGQDYIVVSKKQVEIPQIGGIDSEDTIWIKMTEGEILTMNNAIVDSYKMLGSKLYATIYTEAGVQDAATPTYVPSGEVAELINVNPNIIEEAKNALINRYRNNAQLVRNETINPTINNNGQEGEENLKTKVEESGTNSKEDRKQYLQSLSSDY